MPWNEQDIWARITQKNTRPSATDYLGSIFKQAEERGDDWAVEPIFPGAPPQLSIPRSITETYRSQVISSPDPVQTETRLKAAYLASQVLGVPVADAYENYESITQELYHRSMQPKDWLDALSTTLKAAVVGTSISQKMNELWKKGPDIDIESDPIWQQVQQLKVAMPLPDEIKRSLPVEWLKKSMEFVPSMISGLDENMIGQFAGAGLGMLVGSFILPGLGIPLAGMATLGSSIALTAASTEAGRTLGGMIGTAISSRDMERGSEYFDMLEYRDPKSGARINPKVAWQWANVYGTIAGVSEAIEFGNFFKGITGLTDMTQGILANRAKEIAADSGEQLAEQAIVKRHFLQFLSKETGKFGDWLADTSGEALQEAFQETAAVVAEERAKAITSNIDKVDLAPAAVKEITKRITDTFVGSFVGIGAMSGIPGAMRLFVDTANETGKTTLESKSTYKTTTQQQSAVQTDLTGVQAERLDAMASAPLPKDLRFQETAQIEGERYTMKAGNAKGKLLDAITYDIEPGEGENPGTVVIRGVQNMDNPAIVRATIRNISQQYQGWDIQWNPTSAAEQELKSYIVRNNPRGPEAGLQLYRPYDEIDERASMDRVRQIVKEQRPGWNDQDVQAGTYVFEKFAQRMGMAPEELAQKSLAPHVVENFEPENIDQAYGVSYRRKFDESIRTVIGLGPKANPSTLMHEMTHAVVAFAQENKDNPNVGKFLTELEGAFGVENGNWDAEFKGWTEDYTYANRSYYEAVAYALEDYLAFKKAPEGKEGVLAKLAQFVIDIYNGLKQARVKLSPEIESYFDNVLSDNETGGYNAGIPEERITKTEGLATTETEKIETYQEPTSGNVAPQLDRVQGKSEEQKTAVSPNDQDFDLFQGQVQDYNKAAKARLDLAKQMESQGFSKDEIEQETGWRNYAAGWAMSRDWKEPENKTETPSFRKWFGKSKVVDENGKPKVVYHGTSTPDLEAFRPAVSTNGIYFADTRDYAQSYAKGGKSENTISTYLSLQEPLMVDAKGGSWKDLRNAKVLDSDGNETPWTVEDLFGYGNSFTDRLSSSVRKTGFDGIIIRNIRDQGPQVRRAMAPTTVYVALNPEQIKSTENRGTWSSEDARILYQGQTETPEFKSWFGESKVVDETGAPQVMYSGHMNAEMYGDRYNPARGTAGGFYATSDPSIASHYATGKFGIMERYEDGSEYRIAGKNGKYTKRLWQFVFTDEMKQKLDAAVQERDKYGDPVHPIADMAAYIEDNKKYDPQARVWAARGGIYNLQNIYEFYNEMGDTIVHYSDPSPAIEEVISKKSAFEDLLDAIGVNWNSYTKVQPGVFPVFLSIKNPLDTDKPFPQDLMAELEARASKERVKEGDKWTRDYPLKQWVQDIKADDGNHYWATQIPAKALPILKQFGYDGVRDIGGKGGGEKHDVAVAFDPTQIKSAIGNKGSFDPDNPSFLYQGEVQDDANRLYNNETFKNTPKEFAYTYKSEHAVLSRIPGPMPGKEILKALQAADVGYDEIRWSGLDDFLATDGLKTAEEVTAYLSLNRDTQRIASHNRTSQVTVDGGSGLLINEISNIRQSKSVQQPWHEVIFRSLVKSAAEDGYDAVAWPSGTQIVKGAVDGALDEFAGLFGSKWGAQVHESQAVMENGKEIAVHTLPITDEMRANTGIGQYLYQGDPDIQFRQKAAIQDEEYDAKFQFGKAVQDAIRIKRGVFTNAINVEGVGPVAVVWGYTGDPEKDYHDGYGLAHILIAHEDTDNVVAHIQEVLEKGSVSPDRGRVAKPNRKWFEYGGYRVIVDTDFAGRGVPWIVTAYAVSNSIRQIKSPSESPTIPQNNSQAAGWNRSAGAAEQTVGPNRVVVKRHLRPNDVLYQGVSAFHGSGAGFDKFDTAWIGSGEGAQAYGWGLYFTESKHVARGQYADRIGNDISIHGEHKLTSTNLLTSADINYIREKYLPNAVDDNYGKIVHVIGSVYASIVPRFLDSVKEEITKRSQGVPLLKYIDVISLAEQKPEAGMLSETQQKYSAMVKESVQAALETEQKKIDSLKASGTDTSALEAVYKYIKERLGNPDFMGITGGRYLYNVDLNLRGDNPGSDIAIEGAAPPQWNRQLRKELKEKLEDIGNNQIKWMGVEEFKNLVGEDVWNDIKSHFDRMESDKSIVHELGVQIQLAGHNFQENRVKTGAETYQTLLDRVFFGNTDALDKFLAKEGIDLGAPEGNNAKYLMGTYTNEEVEKLKNEAKRWVTGKRWTREDFIREYGSWKPWDDWVEYASLRGEEEEVPRAMLQQLNSFFMYDNRFAALGYSETRSSLYHVLYEEVFQEDALALNSFLTKAGLADIIPPESLYRNSPYDSDDISKLRAEVSKWFENSGWDKGKFIQEYGTGSGGPEWPMNLTYNLEEVTKRMSDAVFNANAEVLNPQSRTATRNELYAYLSNNLFYGDGLVLRRFLDKAGIHDLVSMSEGIKGTKPSVNIELRNTLLHWESAVFNDQQQALTNMLNMVKNEDFYYDLYAKYEGWNDYTKGHEIYYDIADVLDNYEFYDKDGNNLGTGYGNQWASELLYDAGFDGITYPVAFLSGGQGEKGYNYVMFNDEAVSITHRLLYQGDAPKTPQYVTEMQKAIAEGQSFDDIVEFFEAPFIDQEKWGIPDIPQDEKLKWYRQQYDALTSPETEAPKNLQGWLSSLKSDGFKGLRQFMRTLYTDVIQVEESKPGPWADQEEVEEWSKRRDQAYEIRKDLPGPITAAALAIGAKNRATSDAFIRSVYGIIARNPEEYASIYANVMGDEELAKIANTAVKQKYADIEDPTLAEPMSISQKRELAGKIRDERLSKQIRSGEISMDETARDYIKRVEQERNQAKKQIKELNVEIGQQAATIDANVRRIAEQRMALKETEKQIARISERITNYLDNNEGVPKSLENQQARIEKQREKIRQQLVDARDWQEINRQYTEAQNRYDKAQELIDQAKAAGEKADVRTLQTRSEAAQTMRDLKPKLVSAEGYRTSAQLQTYLAKLEERTKLQDQYRERQAEQKALREVREYRKKLIDSTLEKPANNANIVYKKAITRIQQILTMGYAATITPEERAAINMGDDLMLADAQSRKVERLLNEITEDKSIASVVSKDWLRQFLGVSRREITLAQWEEAHDKITTLRQMGRDSQSMIEAERARKAESYRAAIEGTLKENRKFKPAEGPNSTSTFLNTVKDKAFAFEYAFKNARRFLRDMDGGVDGQNVELAWNQMNRFYRQEMEQRQRRQSNILDAIQAAGHNPKDWYEELVTIPFIGKNDSDAILRKSDLMALALGFRNPDSAQALLYGNFFSEYEKKYYRDLANSGEEGKARAYDEIEAKAEIKYNAIKAAIDEKLDDSDIALLNDVFEKDGQETAPRLAQVVADVENAEMTEIEHYFPILRKGVTGQPLDVQIAGDILDRTAGLKRQPAHGFTKDRIKISPWNQADVEMDLLGTWLKSINRQEHYIAFAQYGKTLDSVYLDRNVQEQIRNTFGNNGVNYIKDYIAEVKNPSEMMNRKWQDEAMRTLRGNLGAAYLAYRTSSVLKQVVTSPWPALPYAGPQLFTEALKMMVNPVKYVNDAESISIVLKNRNFSLIDEAIKNSNAKTVVGKTVKNVEEFGMRGLEWADRTSVAIGWMAIYNKALEEFGGDREKAIEKADDIILMTQPSSRGVDLSPAYRDKNPYSQAVLQFTQALNVVYQNIFYDIPAAVKQHNMKVAVSTAVAYVISGVLLQAMVSRPPKDDDDPEKKKARYAFWAISQATDSLPLIGEEVTRILKRQITGEKSPQMADSAIPGIAQFMDGIYSLSGGDIDSALSKVARGLGMMAGAPVSGINEALRVIQGDPEALLGRKSEQ